jgi:iron complex outermembrane recepter protein
MRLVAPSSLVTYAIGGVLWGVHAYAQDVAAPASNTSAAHDLLQEVVVTARREAESMMRVPVAVSALSAAEIERTGVMDLSGIADRAPQVFTARAASGSGASFVIRGIGSSPLDTGIEQSVSINLDGVQVSRGRLVTQTMMDLAQVEVLKGPQALFFGKNSPAGVISITSNGPTDYREGSVRVGYEWEAREHFIEAIASGPLSDTFRARLALRASEMDGWLKNPARSMDNPWAPEYPLPGAKHGRQPMTEDLSGRFTLEYAPDGPFSATLKVLGSRYEDDDYAGGYQVICGPGVSAPDSYGIPDPAGDCRFDENRPAGRIPPQLLVGFRGAREDNYTDVDSGFGALTLKYELENVALTAVTGHYRIKQTGFDDFTATSIGNLWASINEDHQSTTQEIRAASDFDGQWNFTLGGYYEDFDRDTLVSNFIRYVGADPATGKFHSTERVGTYSGETYSVFGQLRYNPVESVELAAGVRWTRETRETALRNDYVHPAFAAGFSPAGVTLGGDYSDEDYSPEATATWYLDDDTTLYVAYKTGYKSGGFANPSTMTRVYYNDPILLRIEAEDASGGEIGYKARLFDRRLQLQATVYHYDYEGLQLSSYDAPTVSFIVRNAAEARTRGVELSARWSATDRLVLDANAGYNDAKYRDFSTAACYAGQTAAQGCVGGRQDLTGEHLHRAPEWMGNLGLTYDIPLAAGLNLQLSADAKFSGAYNTNENQNPVALQDSYWLFGAGARLEAERWEVAFIGRNVEDDYIMQQANDKTGSPGQIVAPTPRARELIMQGTYRF